MNQIPGQNLGSQKPQWEPEIDQLLDDLLETQQSMLQLLQTKRQAMTKRDLPAIESLQSEEESLGSRLADCHQKRREILDKATMAKLPSTDIQSLAAAIKTDKSPAIETKIKSVKQLTEQLRQHSLTNWIIAQRNLLHVSQLLEIIATGGNKTPTYGDGKPSAHNGFVLDQEA